MITTVKMLALVEAAKTIYEELKAEYDAMISAATLPKHQWQQLKKQEKIDQEQLINRAKEMMLDEIALKRKEKEEITPPLVPIAAIKLGKCSICNEKLVLYKGNPVCLEKHGK